MDGQRSHSPDLIRKRHRDRERRWTTGIEKGQFELPKIADDHILSQDMTTVPSIVSLSSWGSCISDIDNTSSSREFSASPTQGLNYSQQEVQEILHMNKTLLAGGVANTHTYQLSYELAVDTSPLSPSNYSTSGQQVAYCYHVINEIVTTEKRYVADLTDIIEGYYTPLQDNVEVLCLTNYDIVALFSNIIEIKYVHQLLLKELQDCGRDYKKIGQCFIDFAQKFKIYTEYCNNYPDSVRTLSRISGDKEIMSLLKQCQQKLKHALPLGAYLLKPVQRVLKYALMLGDLLRHMAHYEVGYPEIKQSFHDTTNLAEHINEMKKKYDSAIRVQEIQALLSGWERHDLKKYGEIVAEDVFRVSYSKTGHTKSTAATFKPNKEHYVFMFDKVLLITKKKDDEYHYRHHVEMKDIQLTEHLKDPMCFQIRQISSKATLTFQANSSQQKKAWTTDVKRLLMMSVPNLPDKARQMILAGFTTDLTGRDDIPVKSVERRKHKGDSLSTSLISGSSSLSNSPKTKVKLSASMPHHDSIGRKLLQGIKTPATSIHPHRELSDHDVDGHTRARSPGVPNISIKKLGDIKRTFDRSDSDNNVSRLRALPIGDHSDDGSTPSPTVYSSQFPPGTPDGEYATTLSPPPGVRASISSPDLKQPDAHTVCYNGNHNTTEVDTSFPNTPSSELTPEINDPLFNSTTTAAVFKNKLETIHSADNTPRNSLLAVDNSPLLSYKSPCVPNAKHTSALPSALSTTSANKKSKSLPRKLQSDAMKQERLFEELMGQSPNTQQRKPFLSKTLPPGMEPSILPDDNCDSKSPLPCINVEAPLTLSPDPPHTPSAILGATPVDHYKSFSCDSTHYERHATPYTSIEDIRNAVEEELSSVMESTKEDTIVPKRKLSEPSCKALKTDEDEKNKSIKRWHSFQNKHKIDTTDSEPQKKDPKDSVLPFMRRGHSFSKSRKQRPISVIGLVHTSNSEDLVELEKAKEQCHAPEVAVSTANTPTTSLSNTMNDLIAATPSTPDPSVPITPHRKNRWSLLRTKGNRHKKTSSKDLGSEIDASDHLDLSVNLDSEQSYKDKRKISKVNSLAREYSQKIKVKDHSTSASDIDSTTPTWLSALKAKRQTHSSSMLQDYDEYRPSSSQDVPINMMGREITERTMSPLSAPASPRSFDTYGYSTDSTLSNNSVDFNDFFNNNEQAASSETFARLPEGDGTLKRPRRKSSGKAQEKPSWVRTLVKRFSGSK